MTLGRNALMDEARKLPWDLALSSAVALLFLAARMAYARSPLYGFLAYNLVLAWIPLALSSLLERRQAFGVALTRWHKAPLFLLWLAFFPNAPYLVTDLIHLRPRGPVPHWYDIALFTAFAWCGMVLALRSLACVESLVRDHVSLAEPRQSMTQRTQIHWQGWAFVTVVSFLTGVYLGRFLRLNSWELFTDPGYVAHTLQRVRHAPLQALGVSVAFGALVWMSYLTLGRHFRQQQSRPSEPSPIP